MRKIIMSQGAYPSTQLYFKSKGFEVLLFNGHHQTYEAVNDHPDMHLFYDEILYGAEDLEMTVPIVYGEPIKSTYPFNIAYNIAKVGNHVFCNYTYTAAVLKEHIKRKQYTCIDVKQGYAKCNIAIINNQSIITSDIGIHKKALENNIASLLISSGHIYLEGMNHGFIGGCSVSFDKTVFFNGDISQHPDYNQIKSFVESKGYSFDYVKEPLADIGSFIIL